MFLATPNVSNALYRQREDIALGYPELNGRYGGVFGKEAIAGGYIQKFSILAILSCFFLKFKKLIYKKLFIVFITTFLAIGILLTLDRIPFIIYFFHYFFYRYYSKITEKRFFYQFF